MNNLLKLTVAHRPEKEHNLTETYEKEFRIVGSFLSLPELGKGKSVMKNQITQVFDLKPTLILTTLLFLLVAPTPDSQDVAEMSANFLVLNNNLGLLASEVPVQPVLPVQEELLK